MGASQSWIADIDLLKGNDIVRIYLTRRIAEKPIEYLSTYNLIVEKFKKPKDFGLDETLWNGKGKILKKICYYEIAYEKAFTKDIDELKRIRKLQDKRYRIEAEIEGASLNVKFNAQVITNIVRKRAGFKRTKPDMILGVKRNFGSYRVAIQDKNKVIKYLDIGRK